MMATQLMMSKPSRIVFANKTADTSSFCINYRQDGDTTWAIAYPEDTLAFFYEDSDLFLFSDTPRVKLTSISLNSTQEIVGRVSCKVNETGSSCFITTYCYLYTLEIWDRTLYITLYDLLESNLMFAEIFTINLN